MTKKIEWKAGLLGATLPLFLLLASLNSVWLDMSNYEESFRNSGFDYSSSIHTTEQLFDYFKGPMEQEFSIELFDEKEASHMHDVKIALKANYVIFYALGALWLVVLIMDRRLFFRTMLIGGIAGLLVSIIISLIPFDFLFIWFHRIVFPQGNWLFAKGALIVTIYTEGLFERLAGMIFARFFGMLLAAVVIGWGVGFAAYQKFK